VQWPVTALVIGDLSPLSSLHRIARFLQYAIPLSTTATGRRRPKQWQVSALQGVAASAKEKGSRDRRTCARA